MKRKGSGPAVARATPAPATPNYDWFARDLADRIEMDHSNSVMLAKMKIAKLRRQLAAAENHLRNLHECHAQWKAWRAE